MNSSQRLWNCPGQKISRYCVFQKSHLTIKHRNIYLTESTSIKDMVNHPAFSGFGEHLLPRPQDAASDLPLREVGKLMPWHSHIQPPVVLQAVNRMISDISTGKKVFYSFYDAPQKQRYTGLFFFRGKKGAPFALICPGGGFAYIGSLHEGFPLAEELSRMGYNAFVLQYRTGGEAVACEDMAAAVSFSAVQKLSRNHFSERPAA